MKKYFWFQVILHTVQAMNYLTCKYLDTLTSTLGIAHRNKTHFYVLLPILSIVYQHLTGIEMITGSGLITDTRLGLQLSVPRMKIG